MRSSVDPQPEPLKARNMTPEGFASFLSWLSPDQGQAATEYLALRQTLVKYFVRKVCVHAEDLADRTLDRVALISQREPDKYPKPMALCCGVARRVWLEYMREVAPDELEDNKVPAPVPYEDDFTEQEINCLGSCLDRLPPRDRELITQYHQFQGRQKIETRKQLAQLYGGLNKVRIIAYRIRSRLHNCISGCVQRSAFN